MEVTSTQSARRAQWLVFFLHFYLITLLASSSYAQTKIFAASATVMSSQVDGKDNATRDDNDYASVKSYGGALLGIGRYSGELQLNFAQNVPANRTTFIRIGYDQTLLNALLGGNLGSSLASVLGNVLLGDHFFTVGARNANGDNVLTGSSNAAFATTNIKLVRDAQGNYYLAVTPTVEYRSVFIKDVTNTLLLSTPNEIRVYNAFYVSGTGNCDPPFATDYEGTGATLSLLSLGAAGVTNIEYAIDGNPVTSSNISLGLIAAAGTISQNIYFNSPSRVGDELNIRLSVSQALANVGLLGNITVEAYNGNTLVYTRTGVAGLLNLDLLGLLNSGQPVTIPFSPNVSFDRVKITLSALLNISLTQSLNIHEVTRSAPRPTFTAPLSNSLNACYNTTATLGATTAATNELLWYEALEGGSPLATTPYNGTYTTPQLTANKTYYVAARQIGCAAESVRVPVTVTVNPQITFAATTFANATVGSAYSKQLTAATGGTPSYTYALAAGSTLPPGLTLSAAGLLGGVPTQAGTYNFSITVTDSKGCSLTAAQTLVVTATLTLTAATLPDGTVGVGYPTQVIPPAAGGSTPYTYTAVNLPPGLGFNPTTREITGTPTVAGPYVVTVNVSDADGNTASMNYTINVKNALVLPNASLADGTVGIAYPTQLIPAATGGTPGYTYIATNLPPGLSFNPATLEITGTPTTTGTFTVNVQVTDAAGVTANNNYTVRVVAPLAIAGKTLADGTVGVVYATEILPAATGGVGPYTYVATNVPAGLSFNPTTRALTGTPTGAGNFTITLTVTDAEGRQVSNTYALKVNGALTLATATLPDGTVGAVYPVQTLPAVSGGTGPYVYEALNLPAGLSFNTTTRELTGTPTTGGSYTFAVKVTDAASNTVTTNYQIKVNVGAPVVAAVTVCSGTTATLTVTNTQAGVTYNWYGASGSTPLATGNNGNFTTGNIAANTIFYVEAVSGTAVSARTAVNVTANPAPNPAVILTNNQTINANQSTTVRASADAGNTINWYSQPTGGTVLGTGTDFTTPSLTVTTTYYAESVSAQGCASTVRMPVVVNVITGGVGADCNAANAQVSGTTGLLCALCNVANPGASVDADKNNFTRITLSVGVGATGFQRLIFPSTGGLATDSIRLDLATPTGLLDLSVLGGITVNVMKNNAVVRTLQLNSSLVYLQLLGGNRFEATFAAGADFDRVEVRFQAVVAALSSLDIYGAQIVYPSPTITGNGQTICYNTNATISAVANGNTQIAWFANATGGTAFATTSSYTTPNLTASTTYYIEVSRNGCANTARIPVVVNVVPLLDVPTFAAPTLTACEGSPVTLAVENPNPAVTYRWYEVSTGGTVVHTGATYTLSNVTATKNYYVEAYQQGCTSSGRGSVQVVVNPRPILPQVQASVSTINAGQTVVITASSSETDVTFNWFTSPTAATPIHAGATYVTPPLNTTTSYYVEARSNTTGCVSPSRVMITITVNTGAPNPTPCVSPVSEENGVVGVALLAGVSNPGLAVDNDTQTASTLSLPVGALGAYVYQRLNFQGESIVGDTLRVLISSPGRLLSLNLLGSVQLSTLRNGTSNNDLINLNNSLINLELLSGGSQALLTFVPTQIFNQVEIRLNGGVVGALNSINVNYAQHVVTVPTVTSANVVACSGQPVTLSVQDKGLTYTWYNEGGAVVGTGATITTPAITAATKFYVTASANACESLRALVNVTLAPIPDDPELLANNVTTCTGGSVVLQVKNPVAGLTYKWYDSSNTYLADGTTYTVNNVTGLTTYTVRAENSCGTLSAPTGVQVNAGTLDAPIVGTPNVTIRANSRALLSATSSTPNAIINWYANMADVLPLAANSPSYLTPTLSVGTYTYYVEAEVLGGCKSLRIPVTVTVTADGNSPVPCTSATLDLDAGVSGIALLAGVFNRGLAVDNNAESGSSLVMPVGAVGSYVYHRVGFTSLSHVGDTVRVRITSPGKLLSLAVIPSISVLTYNGNTSNNDVMEANNPLINLALLSDGSAATLSFVPTQAFNGVELRLNSGLVSAFTSVDLNYVQRVGVAPQVEAATANACEGGSALLSVKNPVSGITYKWYLGNTYLADGNTYATPIALTAGTYVYNVRAVADGCESVGTPVQVTILPTPAPPTPLAGNPTEVCFGTAATLSVNQIAGVTYNWYANGVAVALNSATYTTPANLTVGTHTFLVEAVNANSCANGNRTPIVIEVKRRPLASDIQVSGNPNVCASTTATLTASSTTVANPTFKWYSDAALTVLEWTGPTFTTPTLTASTTYYVTVYGDNNNCENGVLDAKPVTININPPATNTDLMLSPSTERCGSGNVTLTASSSTVTNPIFTWYTDSNLATPVFTGPSYSPNLTSTQTYYVTVKGDNRCESPASQAKSVTVIVKPIAVAADVTVTGNNTVCINNGTSLTATSSTVNNPIFTWYDDAALTNVVFIGNTLVTGNLTANKTYYVTVKGDNRCENQAGDVRSVTVTVNSRPTAADLTVSSTTERCGPGSVTLTASSATITNPVFTWYSDANLTTLAGTGASFSTPILAASQTYYVTVRGDGKCESLPADAKAVSVVVKPYATAADLSVSIPAEICGSGNVTLTASSTTVTNPIFTWYENSNLTTVAHVGATFATGTLNATKTYYVTVKGDNRCESPAADARTVTVVVKPRAVASDVTLTGNINVCENSTTTLTATSTTVTNPVFTWYENASLTTVAHIGPIFITPQLSANKTYYVTVKGDNKCENNASSVASISIVVTAAPLAPVVDVAGTSICNNSSTTLTVTNPQAGVIYEWYNNSVAGTLLHTGTTYTTGTLNATTDYYVQAVGTVGCTNASARVKVTVTVTNRPTTPTVVSANVTTCGGTATLSVSNPVTGVTYTWYTLPVGGTSVGSGAMFTTPALLANAVYYVEASVGSCTSTARAQVNVQVGSAPNAPANVTAANGQICAGATTALTVNNPDAAVTYKWYTTPNGGTSLYEGINYTTAALTTTTTYYVEAVSIAGGCVSGTRTPVVVNVLPIMATPVVTVGTITTNSIQFNWNAIAGATGYEISIDGGNTWTAVTTNTYTVMGLTQGQTVTITVRAKAASACQTSANANAVTATTNDPFKDELYIPNTFTPNNDGKNDYFLAYGNHIGKFRMRVYNQWGEFVFESQNILQGWDGTYRGRAQPTGVYVYYIDVTFNSGASKTFKGTITLLR
ncbi:Ig-like domain-containing protein [Pedobacter nanyangensis]|uniref:Ig-like domain-containing protein n=1 Tax=Pedobacter nanyangensis TaxID=1562389 RepID=UPI000DE2CFB5|nr:putative Ig domain-containing protein [Pedobacter nanyangensis]